MRTLQIQLLQPLVRPGYKPAALSVVGPTVQVLSNSSFHCSIKPIHNNLKLCSANTLNDRPCCSIILSHNRRLHATASSMAKRNPYDVIGVSKTSTANEIKKAYYQLAKQYHPDTNKDPSAKEKFVEIQHAYEILSDEQKRAQFDQYGNVDDSSRQGEHGFSGGFPGGFPYGFSGFGGESADFGGDIFDQIFQKFGGQSNARGASTGESVLAGTRLSFMEAIKGAKKSVVFVGIRGCAPCSGSGTKPGHKKTTCITCKGSGQMSLHRGGFQMFTNCPTCGGLGTSIAPEAKCTSCNGAGLVRERQSVTVDIPAGVEDGMKVRISGQGNASLSGQGPNGDLIVTVQVAGHPIFKRDGADVHIQATVPLHIAILGGSIRIPTVDGDVDLTIPPGTQPNERKVLRQRGAPNVSSRHGFGSSSRGDQWVTLEVEIPKSLTSEQKRLMMEAFGAKSTTSTSDGSSNYNKSDTSPRATSSDDTSGSSKTEGGFMQFFKDLAGRRKGSTEQ
ncbi:mdj1 protein precursor, variant 2 [Batrachochytrium dendrobatidis]|nr:mdj1 protein precursor, variant 2 [Batrachochytrium dendrobatidis]